MSRPRVLRFGLTLTLALSAVPFAAEKKTGVQATSGWQSAAEGQRRL